MMTCCTISSMEEKAARARSREIEKIIAIEKKTAQKDVKLLLLGEF